MKSVTTGVLLFVALGLPLKVDAEPRFWLHAGVNHSTADSAEIDLQTTLGDDFSGTALRFGLGMTVSDWINIEAGWARFGSNRGIITIPLFCIPEDPGPCETDTDAKQSGSAYWIVAVPTVRRGNFTLFGKLGASRTTVKTGDASNLIRFRDTDNGVLLGAGAAYHFTHSIGVRFDFERMGSAARTVGIGVEYRF